MKQHIYISGRVQGVGFRHFTRKNAEALGIKGWVKNLSDGRVEAVFQGDKKDVSELIERCRKGPVASYVKNIEISDTNDKTNYDSFKVKF